MAPRKPTVPKPEEAPKELPRELNVVHKVNGKTFKISRRHYLDNPDKYEIV